VPVSCYHSNDRDLRPLCECNGPPVGSERRVKNPVEDARVRAVRVHDNQPRRRAEIAGLADDGAHVAAMARVSLRLWAIFRDGEREDRSREEDRASRVRNVARGAARTSASCWLGSRLRRKAAHDDARRKRELPFSARWAPLSPPAKSFNERQRFRLSLRN